MKYLIVKWEVGTIPPIDDKRLKWKMVSTKEKAEEVKKRWEEECDPLQYVKIYHKKDE